MTMKFKAFLIPLVLMGVPKLAFTTPLTSVNNFLLAAQGDLDDVNAERKAIPELGGLSSWIEDTQVRVNAADELNTKDSTTQSYDIRIKPKAWGQREAEQKILQLRSSQEDVQYHESLNAELSRRYAIVLEFVTQHNQTRFLLESDDLLNKQVQMNRNLVNSSEFNEENLLDVEIAFEQAKDLVDLNLHRLNDLQSQLDISADSKETLKTSGNAWEWLVTVPQMQEVMAQPLGPQQAPEVIKSRLELEQARAENQYKKSTQQLGVNLLGFKVDDSRDPKKELQLGFLVGINIPLGAENFQSTKSRHDIYNARVKLHDSVYTTTQGLDEKRTKMKWLVEEWRSTQKQMAKLNERLQKDYAKTNPNLALTLQFEHAKKLKELQDIHQEALAVYVSYLAITGQLAERPLRNWLHADKQELQATTPQK